jgi:predicted nuclease of restriction endonuclease-like RecB superfamily
LLPVGLLLVAAHEPGSGRVRPRYLGERDEVWVRCVLDAFDGYVGRTAGERAAELPERIRAIAREHGISARAADGVAHVVARKFQTELETPLVPARVRAVVFEEAGRDATFDRAAALARAAARWSVSVEELSRALFADRAMRRRISAPAAPLSAATAVELYNLALVQGLLQRSESVRVELREHVRAVVRFAKLSGLLCTCEFSERGTRLEVSGPLSILRHTTKYGFALASFFPAVVATPGFRLQALCVLGGEPVHLELEAADRIARTHRLPRDADSAVERALARDVRRLGSEWSLSRESHMLTLGARAVFPDFSLRHAGGFTLLVEVVGFYTPEYLRSKLEALQAAAAEPLIVCIDEALACADGEVPGAVLRFRRRIDAAKLIEAAERLRAGRGATAGLSVPRPARGAGA